MGTVRRELHAIVIIVRSDQKLQLAAADAVTQSRHQGVVLVVGQRFRAEHARISRMHLQYMSSAEHLAHRQARRKARLATFLAILGSIAVAEHVAADLDIEVPTAQVGEVVADADLTRHVAETYAVARGGIAVTQLSVAVNVELQDMPSQDQPRAAAQTVAHLSGVRRHLLAREILAVAVVAPMVGIGHSVSAILVVGRHIDVALARERRAESALGIERTRTVIVPIGYGGGLEILGEQRRLIRTRRDRIVDIGLHGDRIGHIGHQREFLRRADARGVILRHLDLLGHLRRYGGRQAEQRYDICQSLHRQFILAILLLASSTMPSSAGEYPSATLW